MNLKKTRENQQSRQIGHYKNLKYPFFKKSGRRTRLLGKKKDRAFLDIKKLINTGITSPGELATRLGRSPRQMRRYIKPICNHNPRHT